MKAMYDNELDILAKLIVGNATGVNKDIDNDTLNEDNRCGWSCLHAAAYLNRVECVRILVNNSHSNIAVSYQSRLHTALHVACCKGHVEVVKIIMNALQWRHDNIKKNDTD